MTRALRWLPLLWLLSALLALAASADVQVYHAQHRIARDLLPIAEVAMDGGGSVALDEHSNSLVLVGSKAEIEQAVALLKRQDQRLRTVLIQHEMNSMSNLDAAGVRIRWSVGGDGFRVGNVVAAPGESGVSIAAAERARSARATQAGSVRVLEGSWGRIASGADLLVPIGSRRNPGTAVVSAESGFEVRPQILGDGRIRLDLRPFQGSLKPGGVVQRSGAETTLVVRSGETTVVGGLGANAGSESNSLLTSAQRRDEQDQQVLLVTATIDAR